MGALTYVIPITVFAIEEGSSYYLTWIVFGHIAGIYSPLGSVIIAGFMLHVLTATTIGIIAGLFLYKTNILNISKPSNGFKYGLLVGTLVFVIFAIPVQEFVLGPEFARTIAESSSNEETTTPGDGTNISITAATENSQPMISKPSNGVPTVINQLRTLSNSLIINLVFWNYSDYFPHYYLLNLVPDIGARGVIFPSQELIHCNVIWSLFMVQNQSSKRRFSF